MNLKELALEIPRQAFGWRVQPPAELFYGSETHRTTSKASTSWDGVLYDSASSNNQAYFSNPLDQLKRLSRSPEKLVSFYKMCEIAYACVEALARSAVDPEFCVEEKRTEVIRIHDDAKELEGRRFKSVKRSYWAKNDEHLMSQLMMRPNDTMSTVDFFKCWIVMKHVAGIFYAEKIRDDEGQVVQLWPINPLRVSIKTSRANQVKTYTVSFNDPISGQTKGRDILAENMFVDRNLDLEDPYFGHLSPLAAAVGSVDADILQTNYIRAYFQNAGVPSGVLTVQNKTINEKRADKLKRRWMDHFSSFSGGQHSVVVLDQNATYQPLGARLKDLEAESVQGRLEAKICTVYGVPPGLIFSYTGLTNMSYTNQQQALSDFWAVKLYPMFKEMLGVLTWQLLSDFVSEDDIRMKRVRVNWDMRGVKALQEDQEKLFTRVSLAHDSGLIDKNEGREAFGFAPDPYGYGLFRTNVRFTHMYGDIVALDGSTFGSVPALQAITVTKDGAEVDPADAGVGADGKTASESTDSAKTGADDTDTEKQPEPVK